jgi:8-oxo-dGTP diphosphatase
MTLAIDLVPHMDAGDRDAWEGDQNVRPLTDLGRRQAAAMADALATGAIDALYASPALRCRQTLEPLAERLGLSIDILPELGEEAWRRPDGWPDGPGGAYVAGHAAGRAMAGIEHVRADRTDGRVVICSHGHIIPNLIAFLIGAHALANVPDLKERGQWYQVRFGDNGVQIELRQADGLFPK